MNLAALFVVFILANNIFLQKNTPPAPVAQKVSEEEVVDTLAVVEEEEVLSGNSENSLVYPGSSILVQSENRIEYKNTSSAEDIRDWYINLFENSGFNVKNSVSTKINGNYKGSLHGASSARTIEVEITQNASSFQTTVVVVTN